MQLYKDEVLDRLAKTGNVAQFVAFRPDAACYPIQSFLRIVGRTPNHTFSDPTAALSALLTASGERKVNVRSYLPGELRSREFVYGLDTVEAALATVQRLTGHGFYTIANETIDVSDGGVSGVVQGSAIEFAPDDTPRCVEKAGVTSLPLDCGLELLNTVYGFRPNLRTGDGERTEFSIHPKPRGWRGGHTLVWERELGAPSAFSPTLRWPNQFSRFIGDKAFGLLIADRLGLPVPRTLVIPRRVAPFEFGTPTGSKEVWTRTCPREPLPGLYTTVKGWTDPFALLQDEDREGRTIASLLRQDAVVAGHSGAAIVDLNNELTIEGRSGEGDRLMLGLDQPEPLPPTIIADVTSAHQRLSAALGAVRMEWVHDGKCVWILQLHQGATGSAGSILVPGDAAHWIEFRVEEGLQVLRDRLESLPRDTGITLIGQIGVTSHIADLVRRAGAPARLCPELTTA